jgi:hypothetical protein
MRRASALRRWAGILAAAAAAVVCAVGPQGLASLNTKPPESRSDLITIDTLERFGELERPPVVFRHDAHTSALAKRQKDCTACHLKNDKGEQSLKFMRLADTGRKAVMDTYHVGCITCHRETRDAGEKSGPETCGECHREPRVASKRQPMGFDRSLHYRHVKAQENKCEACHHAYNPDTEKLFYDKGKEGTCRYCHGETTVENRISMPEAAHLACISCHRKALALEKEAGPVECGGCHDPESVDMIEKAADVPRMQRRQPDAVFVSTLPPAQGAAQQQPDLRMPAVPFDHKAHETYNDTCRVCHHADLNACSSCHTPTGSEKGGFVSLENAMHRVGSDASCVGCHTARQSEPACAACHAPMAKGLPENPSACKTCHMAPATETGEAAGPMQAATLLESRRRIHATYPAADIPEKVVIKALSKDYEPVEMPHRRIVDKLFAGIRDSRLAGYFHTDPGTLCQGCHHHSPASKKPPLCGSCHGKPFEDDNRLKPGLTAAYHRQCMACHEALDLEKPDSRNCISCHIKKRSW